LLTAARRVVRRSGASFGGTEEGRDYVEFAHQNGQAMTDITSGLHAEATSIGAPVPMKVQVVPIAGLPVVAVALAGLVAAVVSNKLWALDFFHVVGGGLWTGIDLFVGFIIGPIIGRLPVPARIAFSVRFMPTMVLLMPTLVITTLVAGWQLARYDGTILTSYSHHGWVVASIIVVGVMAVIAIGILEPANLGVLFELRKSAPDGELIGRLMRRFIYTAGITGGMQVATLVIMTRLATT
jgi:hypothetical protein